MTQEQKHLQAIAEIIAKFLKKEDGFNNGFQTWVSGYVSSNAISRLEWSTPKKDAMTFADYKTLGTDLYREISLYLKNNNLKTIEIVSNHIEWECYETTINFKPEPFKVSLFIK